MTLVEVEVVLVVEEVLVVEVCLVAPEIFFVTGRRLFLLTGESSDLVLPELSLGGDGSSFDDRRGFVGGAPPVAGGDFGLGGRGGPPLDVASLLATDDDFSCGLGFFLESFVSGD